MAGLGPHSTDAPKKTQQRVGYSFNADELALLQTFVAERTRRGTVNAALAEGAEAAAERKGTEPDAELRRFRACFSDGWFSPPKFAEIAALTGIPSDELLFRLRQAAGKLVVSRQDDHELIAAEIAYRIWVQLTTRMIAGAQGINWEQDILIKVYDSWYAAFLRIRELMEQVPVGHDSGAQGKPQQVAKLAAETLAVMRPHLTHWQGRFRDWHDRVIAANKYPKLTPQERQREYDDFDELRENYEWTQGKLAPLARKWERLAFPPEPAPERKRRLHFPGEAR